MNQEKIMQLEEIINTKYDNITGIIGLKNGVTKYENYFNGGNVNSTVHVASVTKSIISILIGIALDKGYIEKIDQKIIDFFPNYVIKNNNLAIQKITIRDMMTMTVPYKYQEDSYIKYFTSKDWVTFSLNLLGDCGEIGKFQYAPLIGPDILSGILVNTTGRSVFDFATEYLFTPLGIEVKNKITFSSEEEQVAFLKAKDINGWVIDSCGINAAGWGLTLSTRAMAKIGQLYLNQGRWNKQQIVSKQWVIDSIKKQSYNDELNLAYGYLWWLHQDGFMAMGDGGNVIYVNIMKKTVISITATFKPDVNDRIEFIKEYLEPLCDE